MFWPFTVRTNSSKWWSQIFCKFLAFSLEFQKFFSITRTIFSHSRSEQFWQQNTISFFRPKKKGINELRKRLSKESRTTLLFYSPLCIVILIRLRQFSTLEIAVWNLVARRNVIWMQIIKVVNLALNGRIRVGPNSFWSCLLVAIRPQCIFLIFPKWKK